jgi:alkylation response protein AidB-like acyl-CoA dehydrogenase
MAEVPAGAEILERARDISRRIQGNYADREYPTEDMELLKAQGFNGLWIPKECGGWEAPLRVVNQVFLELAKANSSTAQIFQVHTTHSYVIAQMGNVEQKARFFQKVLKEGAWISVGGSEPGINVTDWKTRLSPVPGGYRLNGLKHFCTGHPGAYYMAAWAIPEGASSLRESVVMCMVPLNQDRVTIHHDWNAMGQRETGSGSVSFQDVFVPEDDVIGEPGAALRPPALTGLYFQSAFTAIYIGIAEAAFEAALDYIRTETRPWPWAGVERAADDLYIQHHLGVLRARIDAATLLLDAASAALEAAAEGRGGRAEASLTTGKAKFLATEAALEMTNTLFQICGARSTYTKFGFDRFWRDARTLTLTDPIDHKLREIGKYYLLKEDPPVTFYS